MKTKEEVIKEAYGEYWEKVKSFVDENGFVKYGDIRNETIGFKDSDIEITDYNFNIDFEVWRPKSLKGLEDNNSWIKIESENDLPKDDCTVFVKVKQLSEPFICHFLFESKDFVETMIYTEDVTHYQPIITPKSPLY